MNDKTIDRNLLKNNQLTKDFEAKTQFNEIKINLDNHETFIKDN